MSNEFERLDDQALSNLLDIVWERYNLQYNVYEDCITLRIHKDAALEVLFAIAENNATVWFPEVHNRS